MNMGMIENHILKLTRNWLELWILDHFKAVESTSKSQKKNPRLRPLVSDLCFCPSLLTPAPNIVALHRVKAQKIYIFYTGKNERWRNTDSMYEKPFEKILLFKRVGAGRRIWDQGKDCLFFFYECKTSCNGKQPTKTWAWYVGGIKGLCHDYLGGKRDPRAVIDAVPRDWLSAQSQLCGALGPLLTPENESTMRTWLWLHGCR